MSTPASTRFSWLRPVAVATALAIAATGAGAQQQVYTQGSGNDPAVRASLFDIFMEQYLSAASELERLKGPGSGVGVDGAGTGTAKLADRSETWRWEMAQASLIFGMGNRATESFNSLDQPKVVDAVTLARWRLQLADYLYQRQHPEAATDSLFAMRDVLPGAVLPDWQELMARSLMASGKDDDAIEVLTETKAERPQTGFARYNLAVAYLREGQKAKGRTALDEIGRARATNDDDMATLGLRDKANLVLGYNFLRDQEGGSALAAFGRVRVDGPFANRALLGMGWAELAPRGEASRRQKIGDEATPANPFESLRTLSVMMNPGRLEQNPFARVGLGSFQLGKTGKDEEIRLNRAMVYWAELIGRDPKDPAVQEAMLAIPFALERVGAHQQAGAFYQRAITNLEQLRAQLKLARESVQGNLMVETIVKDDIDSQAGWRWKQISIPNLPEMFFLQGMITDNPYQEALKNYRNVRMIQRLLEGWEARLVDIERTANGRQTIDSPSPQVLTARAKQTGAPPRLEARPRLALAGSLGVPGDDASTPPPVEPGSRQTLPPVLVVASSPTAFDGPYERLASMHDRINALKPRLAVAGAQNLAFLKELSTRELDRQTRVTEKYLIETRFNLARVYDRIAEETAAGTPANGSGSGTPRK